RATRRNYRRSGAARSLRETCPTRRSRAWVEPPMLRMSLIAVCWLTSCRHETSRQQPDEAGAAPASHDQTAPNVLDPRPPPSLASGMPTAMLADAAAPSPAHSACPDDMQE